MRIAISGSHQTGKTSLAEALNRLLPGYTAAEEPYYLLEEEGHEFAALPDREDFEKLLQRSVQSVEESEEDQIFDRCPADCLAYLLVEMESGSPEYHQWWSLFKKGIQGLDLIVYVPVEEPDRMKTAKVDLPVLRLKVDRILRDIVLRDTRDDFGIEMLEVSGSTKERATQVMEWIKSRSRKDT